MGDNQNAKTYMSKSLAEHRAPDVVKRLNEVQQVILELCGAYFFCSLFAVIQFVCLF